MAVSFAGALLPLMVLVGSAVDYSSILNEQSRLQNAADSAALSIAPDAVNLASSDITAKAQSIVTAAMANTNLTGVGISASYNPSTYRTTVSVNGSLATRLMSIIGFASTNISRTAIAEADVATQTQTITTAKTWPVCLMVTAATSNHSLYATGTTSGSGPGAKLTGGSNISLNNCMVQVNTANWDAVETDNPRASIIGSNSEFCFHGGYIHNVANHGTVTTNVNGVTPSNSYPLPSGAKASEIASPGVWDSGCNVFADPLVGKQSPLASAACTSGARTISTTTTLNPGRYCGNMTISGGTVTFAPGFYQIDGAVTISGGSTVVNANNVTLFLNGSSANFDMTGGTVTMTPSTDASAGDLAGVAIYVNNYSASTGCVLADGNPTGPSSSKVNANCVNKISGGKLTYSGLAYFRYLAFWISGTAQVVGNGASLIADYVSTADTSSLSLTGISNAATAAQLLMMQNSQAGYTTTSSVTTTKQLAARLIR